MHGYAVEGVVMTRRIELGLAPVLVERAVLPDAGARPLAELLPTGTDPLPAFAATPERSFSSASGKLREEGRERPV